MQISRVQSFAVMCLSCALSFLCLLSELALQEAYFLVHGSQEFGFKGLNVLLDAVGTNEK